MFDPKIDIGHCDLYFMVMCCFLLLLFFFLDNRCVNMMLFDYGSAKKSMFDFNIIIATMTYNSWYNWYMNICFFQIVSMTRPLMRKFT